MPFIDLPIRLKVISKELIDGILFSGIWIVLV